MNAKILQIQMPKGAPQLVPSAYWLGHSKCKQINYLVEAIIRCWRNSIPNNLRQRLRELIKLFWGIFFLESSHHLKNNKPANEPTSQRAVTLLSQPGLYFGLLWALPLISFEKPPDFPEYSSPPVLQPFGWMDYPLFLHWSWGMTSSVHLRLFQLSISLKDECDWH